MSQPRAEHPKPQFMRSDWINLNGEWTFRTEMRPPHHLLSDAFEHHKASAGFERTIIVPFAPESELSGVADTEFVTAMWYHRSIAIPAEWSGRSVILHFGAVYYRAAIYIDGLYVGQHVGGSVSFALDITPHVKPGGHHDLVVEVTSNLWDGTQPSGKQSAKHGHYGCFYTRTTGIWQTVWLEAVDAQGLYSIQTIADVDASRFVFVPRFRTTASAARWQVVVSSGGDEVAAVDGAAVDGVPLVADVPDPRLWSVDDPALYSIVLRVTDAAGSPVDEVHSYAGMRKVHVDGNRLLLNNEPIYLRLVLDQGFYPDGIWTAPSDDALRQDIELSQAAGFNGARLHQKVFEERFLYWADRLGYLVWGESASWGLDYCRDGMPHRNFLAEWREIIERDRNHPSIIAWTPFNETRHYRDPRAHERVHTDAYSICKALDPTRPVNDASGYIHHITDLYTVHDYTQDPAQFSDKMTDQPGRGVFVNHPQWDAPYRGQPYYVDEFGGIKWNPQTQQDDKTAVGQNTVSWGYGHAPRSLEEFYERLEELVRALIDKEHIAGWCYTQLTDVEQEQNGIYFYDRTPKFDMARIRGIFRMRA